MHDNPLWWPCKVLCLWCKALRGGFKVLCRPGEPVGRLCRLLFILCKVLGDKVRHRDAGTSQPEAGAIRGLGASWWASGRVAPTTARYIS